MIILRPPFFLLQIFKFLKANSKKLIEPYVNFWLSHLYLLKVFFFVWQRRIFHLIGGSSPTSSAFKKVFLFVNYHHHFAWQTCSMELSSHTPVHEVSIWREKRFSHILRFCNFLWKRSVFFHIYVYFSSSSRRGLTFPIQFSRLHQAWCAMHIF